MKCRLEKAVDRRQPVFDLVDQTGAEEAYFRIAEFDQICLDWRVLDKGLIVMKIHFRHVASGMPGFLIGGEDFKLSGSCIRFHFGGYEPPIAAQDSPLGTGQTKTIDTDSDRLAGLAAGTRRGVGNTVRTPESGHRQLFMQCDRVPPDKLRYNPAFDPAGNIGAGLGGGGKKIPGIVNG